MVVSTPFKTLFAVPMTCDSCVQDISTSLYKLDGVSKVEANLKDQLVTIEGTAAPSAIVTAIQATGRDAILRGSGASNSAAVCILETHAPNVVDPVRGLARMVQVSASLTLVDLTVRGLAPGVYAATVRRTGDISRGAASAGALWAGEEEEDGEGDRSPPSSSSPSAPATPRGVFGTVFVGANGRGSVFLDRPLQIWEVIGRAMVVARWPQQQQQHDGRDGRGHAAELRNDPDTLVGVIARSAGVWENDKTVCSCSGKTLWQERREEVQKGML